MKILYNFASRSRPIKFFNTLDNLTSLARHDDYVIVCTLDKDDETMTTKEVMDRVLTYSTKVLPIWGESKSKVDAINKNTSAILNWDVVMNVSDDTVFLMEGFDLEIIKDVQQFGLDSFLHYPDGHVNERLCTHSVLGRLYFERDLFIYNPAYYSTHCDNEAHQIAINRGCYHYIDKKLFEHQHHIWGFGPMDDLLRKTESQSRLDLQTFLHRQKNNFAGR
jgi:hypothetical protein